jgi:hypothetical protein
MPAASAAQDAARMRAGYTDATQPLRARGRNVANQTVSDSMPPRLNRDAPKGNRHDHTEPAAATDVPPA